MPIHEKFVIMYLSMEKVYLEKNVSGSSCNLICITCNRITIAIERLLLFLA